ncbi:MAG: recombinase RecF [Candidatus Cloacimonadota bacterium]|nr:MAG: recombinase RecF [Candidatus Cloacimonadota bacterium]PIE77845.1 MAG: recombinase RecF [Candidatus Delongbacteria bacterium]
MKKPLEKLTIEGFKSIRELKDFKLSNLNLIIGGNGAGKSNFIEFFRMLSAMMKKDGLKEFIAKNGGADSFLFGGPKTSSKIYVDMSFGLNGYEFELAPTDDGYFLVNREYRHFHGFPFPKNLGNGNFNPVLPNDVEEGNASWHTYEAITSWKIYHFHDTSKESGMRRGQDINHNEKLYTDGSNIAAFLYMLREKHPKSYQDIIDAITLVIPFFDDFILTINFDDKIKLDWRQKGLRDFPMRPTHLSDGSIRFICLATALLQPDPPSTIIIDEPELGLHPAAIEILAELIQASSNRTQIIISTQSPALIDHFSIEDIIVVNRENGASIFKRLEEKDFKIWLESYSIGELWSKDIISGSPVYE